MPHHEPQSMDIIHYGRIPPTGTSDTAPDSTLDGGRRNAVTTPTGIERANGSPMVPERSRADCGGSYEEARQSVRTLNEDGV